MSISKPGFNALDYYYFKSRGCSINCQAVIDSEKRFIHLYVGMHGSTHDSCMLRRSALHYLASHHDLCGPTLGIDRHSPYLLGDLGYPLLPWLMVPHQVENQLTVAKALFNKRLQRGRSVVKNAFGILKDSFHKVLLDKSELHLTFLLDVILCSYILQNVLLQQSHEQVEDLLQILATEGFDVAVPKEKQATRLGVMPPPDTIAMQVAP